MCQCFPRTGELFPIDQPEGLQEGGSKPPDPEGIPCGLAHETDMSFSMSAHWHSGHFGSGSLDDNSSISKQWIFYTISFF
jgi:hypothetical protein